MYAVTLNCQRGYRRIVLRKYLGYIMSHPQSPDFILLQEVNSPVVRILNDILDSNEDYKMLRITEADLEKNEYAPDQLAIIYNNKFRLEERFFKEFEIPMIYSFNTNGYLIGNFIGPNNEKLTVASIHLVPGPLQLQSRISSLVALKEKLTEINENWKPDTAIFGGDFNSIRKRDRNKFDEVLAPEYHRMIYKAKSYNSKNYENTNWLGKTIRKLGSWGFSVGLKLDHFYVCNNTAVSNDISLNVEPVVVSDHYPVHIRFNPGNKD